MTAETLERPVAASATDLDPDVRIITAGPVASVLIKCESPCFRTVDARETA